MRLRWVGDSRDYVKWDCVFQSADGRFVSYVPMLRRIVDSKCKHSQPQEHFDLMKSFEPFGEPFPDRFSVFDFGGREYSRIATDEYFQSVIQRLQRMQQPHRVLAFIDPDAGIKFGRAAKDEHLNEKNFRAVWDVLKSGDKLVVHQHASPTSG